MTIIKAARQLLIRVIGISGLMAFRERSGESVSIREAHRRRLLEWPPINL